MRRNWIADCRAALKTLARMRPEERDRLLRRLPEPVGDIAWNVIVVRKVALLCDPTPAMPPHDLDAFIGELAETDPRGVVALVLRAGGQRWELAEDLTGLSRIRLRHLWGERTPSRFSWGAKFELDMRQSSARGIALQLEEAHADGNSAPGAPLADLPPSRKSQWNAALVFERVEECVSVVRRMLGPFVPSCRSWWPEIVREAEAAADDERPKVRRPLPTPDAIRRADEVLGWLNRLPPDDARALWLRADRQSWRKIGGAVGLSHEGARHRVRVTLVALATWLDKQNAPVLGRPRRQAEAA